MSGAARTSCVLARVTPSAGEVSQKYTLLTLSKFERERDRDRETHRERERQTETERDRETESRQTDRQTDRQTNRERERERDVHMLRGSLEIVWRSDGRYGTPNLPSLSFFSCEDPM